MNFEQAFAVAAVVVAVLCVLLIREFFERLSEKKRADSGMDTLLECADDLSSERQQYTRLTDVSRDYYSKLLERTRFADGFENLAKRQAKLLVELEEVTDAATGLCPDHDGELLHQFVAALHLDCQASLDDTEKVLRELRPELVKEEPRMFMSSTEGQGGCPVCGGECVGHSLDEEIESRMFMFSTDSQGCEICGGECVGHLSDEMEEELVTDSGRDTPLCPPGCRGVQHP